MRKYCVLDGGMSWCRTDWLGGSGVAADDVSYPLPHGRGLYCRGLCGRGCLGVCYLAGKSFIVTRF